MTKSMHHRNGSVAAFAALAFGLGLSWSSEAAACSNPPYNASDSDEYFTAAAVKNSLYNGPSGFADWQDYYEDRFGFYGDAGWSNTNYGWNDNDNPELPFGRTMGAFFLLHHSDTQDTADWNTREGRMLKWMYGYAAGAYNEIDDLRAGGCHEWKAADTDYGALVDDRIILYQGFFSTNVVGRAAILMHEAVHYKAEISHTDGDRGDAHFYYDTYILVPAGRGFTWALNPNPNILSVYGAHAKWLLEYFVFAARHTNNTRRNAALRKFKDIISDNIREHDTLPDYIVAARTLESLPT